MNCKRKHLWDYGPEAVTPKRPKAYFWLGSNVHAALAELYKTGYDYRACMTEYDRLAVQVPVDPASNYYQDFVDAVTKGRELLDGYLAEYPKMPWTVLHVPEESIKVPFGKDDKHMFEAICDLIVQYQDGIFVVDHKTPSRTGPSYWDPYLVDLQTTSYVWAVRKWLGQPVVGMIPNVLKKTKTPAYEQKVFTRNEEDLEDFETQLEVMTDELEHHKVRIAESHERVGPPSDRLYSKHVMNVLAPQNTDHCNARYGTCQFFTLCESRGAQFVVDENFNRRRRP
jgi:hypothetical protein